MHLKFINDSQFKSKSSKTKSGALMVYEVQNSLIELKNRAGLTNRELAAALGCSPGAAGAKLTGFIVLTPEERRTIERVCKEAIEKQQQPQGTASRREKELRMNELEEKIKAISAKESTPGRVFVVESLKRELLDLRRNQQFNDGSVSVDDNHSGDAEPSNNG